MFGKTGLKILLLAVISLVAASETFAQTRVHFARGQNSATMNGTIAANGGARHYILRAKTGQTLTATVSSGNGKVDFTQGAVHDTQFSRTVDSNGDVYVDIDNHGGRTNYTLTISIQ
ncbi:MAG: hypothetical protein ACR2N3_06375 [Pyrinomonadaceae bacterium]